VNGARPLVGARSWADGGISDTAYMAWRRSCTVADSGSSCKVETPFGCRKRKGAISALDADVHSVIHHSVAFSGTANGFPVHLQLGLSDRLFSKQARTFDIKGVASSHSGFRFAILAPTFITITITLLFLFLICIQDYRVSFNNNRQTLISIFVRYSH
jgi:hypothetical protein